MKTLQNPFLMTLFSLYLVILPEHSASCHGRYRTNTLRLLQTSGDLTLPANNIVINDLLTLYYEFGSDAALEATNSTNTTDASNNPTNGTEVNNSTDPTEVATGDLSNSTNTTNSTDPADPGLTNSTEITDSTNSTDASLTNSTDLTESTNSTDSSLTNSTEISDPTNSTDSGLTNSTDITNSTNLTSEVIPSEAANVTDIGTDAIIAANTTEPTDLSLTNSTEITNSTDPSLAANSTDTTSSDNSTDAVLSNSTDPNSLTNTTDPALSNSTDPNTSTNSTDPALTNSTDSTNSTNSTDSGTNTTDPTAISAPTHITVAIRFNAPGQYFGIGWGALEMTGADIWMFQIIDSAVQVTDTIALGHFEPVLDTDNGGTNDLEVLGYEIADTYTLVKVRRALNTGDSNDAVIQQGVNDLVWATASSPTVAYHRDTKGIMQVNLA